MPQWIKKTPMAPLHNLPVSPQHPVDENHRCEPPLDVDAGPRSVWECDCGQRWRIAMPFWRPLGGDGARRPAELPGWVLDLSRTTGGQQD